MNYRHLFHAGNFADVAKHSVLVSLLQALNRKASPWCYFDTHAGAGLYDLTSEAARRTGEAAEGIGRLTRACTPVPPPVQRLLEIVAGLNREAPAGRAPSFYPGSPLIAAALARPTDRLVLAERQPEEARLLRERFKTDRRVSVHERDGYEMLKALTPPAERRGLVLVDPPFEEPDEFDAMRETLVAVHGRWAGGIFALWYPLKDEAACRRFLRKLAASGIRRILRTELRLPTRSDALSGSGMVIVNPPWQLDTEIGATLKALEQLFSGGNGRSEVEWLVGE